jgi:hypothetical protein
MRAFYWKWITSDPGDLATDAPVAEAAETDS